MTGARIRELLIGVLLLSGVAACTWSSIQPDGAVASRLYVIGTLEHGSSARVAQAAAPYLGVPFFDIDIEEMAAAIRKLPWLATVSIDRHWPDGVVVRVTEHKPIARWGDDSVLTADFTVITPADTDALPKLPRLAGPRSTGKRVYMRFREMNRQLAQTSDVRIAALTLDARGSWSATLANGLVLRFGRDHLAARLQRFVDYALARVRTALVGAGYVDLRYSDGFAVGGTRAAAAQEKGNEQKA